MVGKRRMITSSAVVSGHNGGKTARRKKRELFFFLFLLARFNPPFFQLLLFCKHVPRIHISLIIKKIKKKWKYRSFPSDHIGCRRHLINIQRLAASVAFSAEGSSIAKEAILRNLHNYSSNL